MTERGKVRSAGVREIRALSRKEVSKTAHGDRRACEVAVSVAPEAAGRSGTVEASERNDRSPRRRRLSRRLRRLCL